MSETFPNFETSDIFPIFNKDRQCLCMFCSKSISEGSINYHQTTSCNNLPLQTQFNKIIFVVNCDEKISCLSNTILSYFRFADVNMLPIMFQLYPDKASDSKTEDNELKYVKYINQKFDMFRWGKINTQHHFIVLS